MSKAWWRQLLDEGAIPALALAFAVGQSPWGSMGFRDRLFPFQSQKDKSPTADSACSARSPSHRNPASGGFLYAK